MTYEKKSQTNQETTPFSSWSEEGPQNKPNTRTLNTLSKIFHLVFGWLAGETGWKRKEARERARNISY